MSIRHKKNRLRFRLEAWRITIHQSQNVHWVSTMVFYCVWQEKDKWDLCKGFSQLKPVSLIQKGLWAKLFSPSFESGGWWGCLHTCCSRVGTWLRLAQCKATSPGTYMGVAGKGNLFLLDLSLWGCEHGAPNRKDGGKQIWEMEREWPPVVYFEPSIQLSLTSPWTLGYMSD